jgi:hypothetical protein
MRGGTVTSTERAFHITFAGQIGPPTRAAFADLDVEIVGANTVLTGKLVDQAALHSILERVQALGLTLLEVRVEE